MSARKEETTNKMTGSGILVSIACFIHARRDTRASTVLWEESDRIGAAEPNISLDPFCIQAESRRRPSILETSHITLNLNTQYPCRNCVIPRISKCRIPSEE